MERILTHGVCFVEDLVRIEKKHDNFCSKIFIPTFIIQGKLICIMTSSY
jgi:hypothetical protein